MSATWKPLSISPQADRPPLLISAIFTPNSYTIHITDLTRLWTESLDRRAILKRSLTEDTAIDPSEDAGQMHVFLQKIEDGIRGDKGTELTLEHDSKDGTADTTSLKLQVTVDLPKPLPPLKWPVFLSQSSPSTFTEKVTMPLLAAQNAQIKATESLVEILKDKDHVIQKLVDKLEASGADMGQIFPIAAAKGGRKPTRAHIEEKVKGLVVFDQTRWKNGVRIDQECGNLEQLTTKVFDRSSGFDISSNEGDSIPEEWSAWWNGFRGSSRNRLAVAEVNVAATPPLLANDNQMEDDRSDSADFQVQSTPPHQSQNSTNKRSSATLNDSSDEDDDLDAPSQRSAIPDSFPISTPPKVRKLGAVGGLKTRAKRSLTPQASAHLNDDTASESEATDSQPSSPQPQPSHSKPRAVTPPKPKRGALGRIGGRKKEPSPPHRPAKPEPESEKEHDGVESPRSEKRSRKLGAIGQKTTVPVVKREIRGRSPVVAEKIESPPRETSEERILRKRVEIEKELAEKAKKPVKKKRKF